jgi:hypothetical protein
VKGVPLSLGEVSEPSRDVREGSEYAWTKPMQGWERVYVGMGDWKGVGRKGQDQYSHLAAELRPVMKTKSMNSAPIRYNWGKYMPMPNTYEESWDKETTRFMSRKAGLKNLVQKKSVKAVYDD